MLDKYLCLPLPFIFTSYIRKFFLYEICFLMFGVLQNKLYLCILLKSFKCHDAIEIFRAALMGYRRRQWYPTPVLLPGKSHGRRSLVGCGPWGRWVRHDWATSLSHIGEGNGNPLQCFCLENPRDGGAWWAAVYAITQGQTQLKWLSSSSSSNGLSLIHLLAGSILSSPSPPFAAFRYMVIEVKLTKHKFLL